jgi:hypothetical protein
MSLAMDGQLAAPKGKYRLVLVDTFEGPTEDELVGDFGDLEEAKKEADALVADMIHAYVYDEQGKLVHEGRK